MDLKEICHKVMTLNHIGVQCDNIIDCENMHQVIRILDKIDSHIAIRLLMHIIHVQELQLLNAKIEYDGENPFRDMVKFEFINEYVKSFSPEMETLL